MYTWTPDSNTEIEDFLSVNPELGTHTVNIPTTEKPLAHRAIRITLGAARTYEEAVVDEPQVWGKKEQLPWLKEDVSSSETSNPRTSNPHLKLGDSSESEEAAPGNLSPELHDEVYRIRDPEPI